MSIKFKTRIKFATIIIVLFVLCSFTLVKTHDRAKSYSLPLTLKNQITRETKGMTKKQIIDYGLNLTAKKLKFAEKNDIGHGKANCVGYAQLCSAICNQALKNNGYKCRAKPVVGYISNCGINLCELFKHVAPNKHWYNFVKDHDFVELQVEDKTYYFDPSIYDVLGNKCITIKTI